MLDFVEFVVEPTKKGLVLYPDFQVINSKDLMIRGGDFYAIWNEDQQMWSTDESVALRLIDRETDRYYEANKEQLTAEGRVTRKHLKSSGSGLVDKWHKYTRDQMWDNFHPLDETILFGDTVTSKTDYATKRLPYPLRECDISAYEEMMSCLYDPEERRKIEWAIGAIVSGDSRYIQKFLVLYGPPKSGKSTVLNLIEEMFRGYCSTFDAKAIGSVTQVFALEAFRDNPLVAIQQDGDLSKIEDNARLNSLISHETMMVNVKYKSAYPARFNTFLLMATNKPVRITDAKSGILRRLIDVEPSGRRLPRKKYDDIQAKLPFELGGIAWHCLQVYKEDPDYYDDYTPLRMIGASNDFYNFVLDSYDIFAAGDGVTLNSAWELYKNYCEDAKVSYPMPRRAFQEELKNYFENFEERTRLEDGLRPRNYYSGFIRDKFVETTVIPEKPKDDWLIFDETSSSLDKELSDCPAQYASFKETPLAKWSEVKTTLKDIDTSQLHYVKPPENHIVIDFDLKDENGEKSYERNLEAARKWKPTYAELSKSGKGIHLHYIYEGDVSRLQREYEPDVEVKIFTGNSSLRRKVLKCCNLPIAVLTSGLKLKGEKTIVDSEKIRSEKALRQLVIRNLNKEIHGATKPSVDFILKILEDAYATDLSYDVSDLSNDILVFCANSTHQAEACLKQYEKIRGLLRSKDRIPDPTSEPSMPIPGAKPKPEDLVFFDVEVFINLLLVVWKKKGGSPVAMWNPSPEEVENLMRMPLVGFNCRRYDNHILYARFMGYDNQAIYEVSQRIINKEKNAFFPQAYDVSYTDIYDFSSKKQSLKKFEIELKIHHQELGLKWDQPAPEALWPKIAEYCINDVVATEAVFDARHADFLAREILADIAGGTVNDTTNSLTTRLIFGRERNPQRAFRYRDLAKPIYKEELPPDMVEFLEANFPEMTAKPHGEAKSYLPYFPGYEFKFGKSTYRGIETGEGGEVWAKPGMYGRVWTFDVASMHPHSATSEYAFGKYTLIFNQLLEARVAIKHKDFEKAATYFDGKLKPYLTNPDDAKMLSTALKIAINSVYGLTAAGFANAFRDERNKDNLIAKRGALFMVDLLYLVQAAGGEVIHIKTDSIKVVDPSPEIQKLIYETGLRYGYTFEVEHIFDRICLVNNAVYIGHCAEDDPESPGHWEATGKQFQVPYVYKKLFTHEPIEFDDLCETKTVNSNLYLDMNEDQEQLKAWHKETGEGSFELNPTTGEEVYHNYIFVGKAGLFCPILPGRGGGLLLREAGDKYYSATGSKDYRWLESEVVANLGKEKDIDLSYYDRLVDEAADAIRSFGDLEWFTAV